jgi:hypothetical protein
MDLLARFLRKQPSKLEFWCQIGAKFSGLPGELPQQFFRYIPMAASLALPLFGNLGFHLVRFYQREKGSPVRSDPWSLPPKKETILLDCFLLRFCEEEGSAAFRPGTLA